MKFKSTLAMGMWILAILSLATACKSENLEDLQEWDLVVIGDNTLTGVPYLLPDLIKADTGKNVVVHNYVISELSALVVLEELRGGTENEQFKDSLDGLEEIVAEAEFIIFFAANYDDVEGLSGLTGDLMACMAHFSCTLPNNCTREVYQPYTDVIGEIFDEMLALRGGKPTIIRTLGFYNPYLEGQQNCGTEMESACIECLAAFNDSYRLTAQAHNIPYVSVYDLFNGPNHDEDPREKGYIGSYGFFPSNEGFQAIAQLIADAGYEPVLP